MARGDKSYNKLKTKIDTCTLANDWINDFTWKNDKIVLYILKSLC